MLKQIIMEDNTPKYNKENLTRKQAITKIGNYGKYAALTALATYAILNPKQAQAASTTPLEPGGEDF